MCGDGGGNGDSDRDDRGGAVVVAAASTVATFGVIAVGVAAIDVSLGL